MNVNINKLTNVDSRFDKYFDRDRCWLLATSCVEIPAQNDKELGFFFTNIDRQKICFGGKNQNSFDTWPGISWTFEEFLYISLTPYDELPTVDSDIRYSKLLLQSVNFSWFIPLLQKMIGGAQVKYEEANAAYQSIHQGKNLRLFPLTQIPRGFQESFLEQQDYNY